MELKVDHWHDVKTEGLPTKEWEWCFFYSIVKGEPFWSVGAYFPEKEHFYVNFGLGGAIVDGKDVVAWAYFDEASFTKKSEDPIVPEKKNVSKIKTGRRRKRNPAKINPVRLVEISEEHLWEKLKELSIDELKDVISEFGMDSKKTAMSLKSRDRLETIIVDAAKRISTRGNAFWNSR